jgi:serine/threonine protein kinase
VPDLVGDHYLLLKVERRSGTFSVVRKAIDDRDESFVAVKLLSGQSDDVTRKVFNNEAKTLKSLSHPNIVRCRWAGTDETGTYVLVLDWGLGSPGTASQLTSPCPSRTRWHTRI